MVGSHVLGPVARQRPDQLALVGKVITAVVQLDAVAMTRQRDIGGMAVEPRCRQHMRAIDRDALRLVDRRGVAVIDPIIILHIERDRTAIVELNRHASRAHALDAAERAVLDPEAALVAQEHHPVAGRELTRAALDSDRDIVAEITRCAQPLARGLVERLHLVVGVGEDDPAGGG